MHQPEAGSVRLSAPHILRHEPAASRLDQLLRLIGVVVLALAIPGAIVGFAVNDPLALSISGALIGAAFLTRDLARWRHYGLSPMTLYAFAEVISCVANTVAILNQDTEQRRVYFLYAIDAHLPLAMKIDWLGLVLPLVGFYWMMRSQSGRAICALAPSIRGTISTAHLLPLAIGGAALGIIAKITGVLPSLGTLTSIIFFLPHFAAFTLARTGVMRNRPLAVWTGLAIAVVEAVRALLFAYLRSDVISPIFAYAIGILMGTRSLRAVRSVYMVPVYAVGSLVIIYFAAFAEVRQRSGGGVERLEAVTVARAEQLQQGELPRYSLVTRLSSINQLTQVGRIVQEDGFLNGETLEYLAYAWIPRFLWPEKPTIAKGSWFALRIGQARIYQGRITNAVNMTVPGELYLNYGWTGLIVGTLAFGAMFAILWSAAGALRERENVLGAAFGLYLMWVGLGGGADLQTVVTLVATYIVFLAASFAFGRQQGRVSLHPQIQRHYSSDM